MFQQTFAIIRNTFFESIRQPIMLVVLIVATLLIIVSNPLSGYTMSNDQKMLIDVGLATIFIGGAVLASFIATSVLGREIENRTALTVISKPVSRPLFVIGKYLGVAGALTLATIYLSFVFLLVEQHTVLQTVRDPVHVPVIVFGLGAALLGLGIGIWCNYFYNMVFSSTVICATAPLAGLAYLLSLLFRHDFTMQPIGSAFKLQLWLGLIGLLIAILVLTAIAIAASTRFGQVMTLCITIGVFMAGMLSDWFFGRPIAKMQQDWTQRITSRGEKDLLTMVGQPDVEEVRRWVRAFERDQAHRQHSIWRCEFIQDFPVKWKDELSRFDGPQRATFRLEKELQARDEAQQRLSRDLELADQKAAAVQWPLKRDDLIIQYDWPLTVERVNGECEVVTEQKTAIFPPLKNRAALGDERTAVAAYRVAASIVPNFQVLWLSDAITQEHRIPLSYLGVSSLYGGLHIIAALSLAVTLFQRREVG